MDAAIAKIFEELARLGTTGIVIASSLVAAVLAVVILSRLKQLTDNAAAETRIAAFQATILRELDELRLREKEQSSAIDQLQAELFLAREQLYRLIEQLHHAQAGRLPVAEITLPEVPK